jgi:aminopeptidase N
MKRERDTLSLSQERFTVNFRDAPALQWKIPLTYFVLNDSGAGGTQSHLMSDKMDKLTGLPPGRAIKLNAEGTGNYRIHYDGESWFLLRHALPRLSVADRVNLLGDAWALAQARRAAISLYLDLVERLPPTTELAEREQIINVFDFINRLLVGHPVRATFQAYARSILRPTFDALGWEPKTDETPRAALLRSSLIAVLGDLEDRQVIAGCHERFEKYLSEPGSLAPDLRAAVLWVVGHDADEATWQKLHELGLKTTSLEEKMNYYDALAAVRDPKLVSKTLPIALTEELPTNRAVFLVGKVARYSGHPDIAWDFAKANMKALLAKTDALGANTFAPSLFTFFSEPSRADELRAYAKTNLPPTAAKEIAKGVDEIEFRAEFKGRLASQLSAWIEKGNVGAASARRQSGR